MNGRREGVTHAIPESEPSLDFGLRILDPRERLLADIECELFRLFYAFGIRITNSLTVVDVGQRVQVDLREDAEAGVHIRLERQ